MRTTQCREVDLIKSEKRKHGDGDPWLAPLNNHLLCIFLKPPPASSTIAMHPFRPCSALSAGHSPSSQTPHPHGCALQRQNTVPCSFPWEALRHLVQEPSMSTCTFNIWVCVSGSWNESPTAKTVLTVVFLAGSRCCSYSCVSYVQSVLPLSYGKTLWDQEHYFNQLPGRTRGKGYDIVSDFKSL